MRKVIVTTTINPPTEAILGFQALKDWELVVIGDRKTPKDYRLERGVYVGPEEQERYDPALSDAIGWNCTSRRSFGFLWARDMGADIVAVVDDDNIPLPGWGENLLVGQEATVKWHETDLPAFDPVGATNYPHLWHRGYPLQLLPKRRYDRVSERKVRVNVQADFWNGDPDIDALCRLEHAPECTFETGCFPLAANRMGPFNSQNTFMEASVLGDYFMFPGTGRMEDIWASYYVQGKGHRVVWNKASVYQKRNEHDLIRDMRMEYLGYENALQLVESTQKEADSISTFLPGRAWWAFQLYRRHFGRKQPV